MKPRREAEFKGVFIAVSLMSRDWHIQQAMNEYAHGEMNLRSDGTEERSMKGGPGK